MKCDCNCHVYHLSKDSTGECCECKVGDPIDKLQVENAKLRAEVESLVNKNTEIKVEAFHAKNERDAALLQLSEAKEQEKAMQAALEEWAEMYGERTTLLLVLHKALERIRDWRERIQQPGGEMDINTIADEALAEFQKETSGEKRAALKPKCLSCRDTGYVETQATGDRNKCGFCNVAEKRKDEAKSYPGQAVCEKCGQCWCICS